MLEITENRSGVSRSPGAASPRSSRAKRKILFGKLINVISLTELVCCIINHFCSHTRSVRGSDILLDVIISGYVTFYQIIKIFVHLFCGRIK